MSPVFNNIGACEPITAMRFIDYHFQIHYTIQPMLILQVAAWDWGLNTPVHGCTLVVNQFWE